MHAAEGMPNQDAFAIGKAGRASWLALADGVSTKPLSHVGAALATRWAGEYLTDKLVAAKPSERLLTLAVEAVRKRLAAHAGLQGKPLNDYACTLLLAVLTANSVTVAKIGDGSIFAVEAYRDGVGLAPLVDCPHDGEGVIELTHQAWKSHLRVRHIADTGIAGDQDGGALHRWCQSVLLQDRQRDGRAATARDVQPRAVRTAARPAAGGARQAELHRLSRLADVPETPRRRADDKTLIVATIPDKVPCSPTTA